MCAELEPYETTNCVTTVTLKFQFPAHYSIIVINHAKRVMFVNIFLIKVLTSESYIPAKQTRRDETVVVVFSPIYLCIFTDENQLVNRIVAFYNTLSVSIKIEMLSNVTCSFFRVTEELLGREEESVIEGNR